MGMTGVWERNIKRRLRLWLDFDGIVSRTELTCQPVTCTLFYHTLLMTCDGEIINREFELKSRVIDVMSVMSKTG